MSRPFGRSQAAPIVVMMVRLSRARSLILSALLGALLSCTEKNPKYCAQPSDCPQGTCDLVTHACLAGDAAAPDGGGAGADGASDLAGQGDADAGADLPPPCMLASCPEATPICDSATGACRACTAAAECTARDPAAHACVAGLCLACATSADCTDDPARPICDANACRACKADAECTAGAGVCLDGGRCARIDEAVFVEFSAAGCPGADGSSASPYCEPNDGAAALTPTRTVLILRGPMDGRLALAATNQSIVVVGRKSATSGSPSVTAGPGAAITVSAGTALVRDLAVLGGSGSMSKGVVATGASTVVSLVRVNVDLGAVGAGLGVQADSGAELHMDGCVVQGNSVGGLLVNGASYDIANSVFANNGYGVQFAEPTKPSLARLWFDTIIGNTLYAVHCDVNAPETVIGSIVVGSNDNNCTLDHTVTTAPAFDALRPFHLVAKLPCPGGDPSPAPDHDIDGDPRAPPLDCGADQLAP
jgi:hypothetical protein